MYRRFLALLGELHPNRYFVALWASQLLSLTAFNMINFTLLLRVYDLTGSATWVSLFVLSFGIPALLFGAIAGVFADRWSRKRVLVTTNALRVLVTLCYLPALDNLATIFIATFLISTVTQFFTPAEGALIPELVERKRLVSANAIFMVTMFLSFVIGYGIAGPLAATGGDQLPIGLAAIMFAIATVACSILPHTASHGAAVKLRDAYRSVFTQLREGLDVVRQSGAIRYGLSQLTLVWSTVGVVMVIVPIFTSQVLGLDLREVSRIIILPIGIGMLAGGYVLNKARRHFAIRRIVGCNLALAGLAVGFLGQVRGLADFLVAHGWFWSDNPAHVAETLTSIGSTLLGLGIAVVMIAAQTMIHVNTEPKLRGRIFGVLGTSINAANTIPVLLAGFLADIFKVTTVVTGIGVVLIVWSLTSGLIGRDRA
jgi:MFS family permease